MNKLERNATVHARHAKPRQRYSTMPMTYGMPYRQIAKEIALAALFVAALFAIVHGAAMIIGITGWRGPF